MAKKALLMILDGWGIGQHGKGDVIYNTPTPYLDYLTAVSAHSQLLTCGEDVGLPAGQMGNSEVGHLNIGAGRIVYQDLVKRQEAPPHGSYFYRWRTLFTRPPLQVHRNRQGVWSEGRLCTLLHGWP